MLVHLKNYLQKIFTEGKNWILTLCDILGVALFLFPRLANTISENQKIIDTTAVLILVISFTIANFTLYTKYMKLSKQNFLSSQSILIYKIPKLHRAEVHYLGKETVKDVSIKQEIFIDPLEMVEIEIEKTFNPHKNNKVISIRKVLRKNAHFQFDLIEPTNYPEYIFVTISLTGVISGIKIEKKVRLDKDKFYDIEPTPKLKL